MIPNILAGLASLVTFVFVFSLLRRGVLREQYAVLWLIVSATALIFAIVPRALYWVSETVGVAKLCCHDNGVKIYETSPGHLKKIIAGHGSAKKKWIKANIVATFNLGKSGAEHECDAAACALSLLVDLGWNGYVVKVPYVPAP
jgi:hypothetical protein